MSWSIGQTLSKHNIESELLYRLGFYFVVFFFTVCGNTYAQEDPHGHHHQHMSSTFTPLAAVMSDVKVDFSLLDSQGRLISSDELKGAYMLLGFGFTHCEIVCPTMASNMAQVIAQAESPVVGVFVSVDTERDTPQIVDKYVKGFSSKLLGLTGSYEQVAEAAGNFHATFVVTKTQKSYSVQHTSSLFLVDPEGNIVDIFAFNAQIDSLVEAMQ